MSNDSIDTQATNDIKDVKSDETIASIKSFLQDKQVLVKIVILGTGIMIGGIFGYLFPLLILVLAYIGIVKSGKSTPLNTGQVSENPAPA